MAAKSKKRAQRIERSVSAAAPSLLDRGLSIGAVCLCFVVGVLIFYQAPLFDAAASIHWDAVDVHYSGQKYFSDLLHAGRFPLWTPYVFSGMPFLADPQVGAWYPLNWPFFLLGITPKAIEWELALHCLIAALGAFFLARDLLGGRWAGCFCGVFYAFSGFFAGHSSHIGIFQSAAVFPWVLWAGLRAARSARWLPVTAGTAGLLVLAGHFQTALYAMCALVLAVAADTGIRRSGMMPAIFAVGAAAAGTILLPAVMTLPGLELTAQSGRGSSDFSRRANATLVPGALMTVVSADHYGAPEVENYTGPEDVTQFFWYQGMLLVPLALAGLTASRSRWLALALIVLALWYAAGPAGGLYSLLSQLPGLRSVRSPINDWFVVALGLALLAAGGIQVLRARLASPWILLVLLAITAGDLWYWDMQHNRLAYSDQSFDELYGLPEQRFARAAAAATVPHSLNRLWSPFDSPGFGPLNGALDTRTEVTYGYNPLTLTRYARYLDASAGNAKLLDSLAVTAKLETSRGVFLPNPTAMPRVFAPPTVSAAGGQEEAARRLASLDPAREAVVEESGAIPQNGPADLAITRYDGDSYTVRCRVARSTLIRLAVPYFPGWRAEIDGRSEKVVPVDLALMGVVVPEGSHEVVFRYYSNWFATGAGVSLLSGLVLAWWLYRCFRRRPAATDSPS
jgi:hypothetical protein